MNNATRNALKNIIAETARLGDEIAALREQQKDLADEAKAMGISSKVIKQLAKESRMDDLQRRDQIALEESIDRCRLELGMLVGTPLGDAAEDLASSIRSGDMDMKVGDAPWMSETLGAGKPKQRSAA